MKTLEFILTLIYWFFRILSDITWGLKEIVVEINKR
jgi:hypothetical protein